MGFGTDKSKVQLEILNENLPIKYGKLTNKGLRYQILELRNDFIKVEILKDDRENKFETNAKTYLGGAGMRRLIWTGKQIRSFIIIKLLICLLLIVSLIHHITPKFSLAYFLRL